MENKIVKAAFFYSLNLSWHVVVIFTIEHADPFLLVFLKINQHALYMVQGQKFHQLQVHVFVFLT